MRIVPLSSFKQADDSRIDKGGEINPWRKAAVDPFRNETNQRHVDFKDFFLPFLQGLQSISGFNNRGRSSNLLRILCSCWLSYLGFARAHTANGILSCLASRQYNHRSAIFIFLYFCCRQCHSHYPRSRF